MKHSNPSGLALGILGVSLTLVSCASTAPPAAAARPDPVQAVATGTATARPEFPGFSLVIRRGEELYCQKRSPTGSRARVVETCFTREQMVKMTDNNSDFFKQLESSGSHDSLRTDSPR
jgi:hypothetical protein